MRAVAVYRGVFLYGESGAGKSSLINAGLIPAAELEGFRADRVRVQPRRGEELVVERTTTGEDNGAFLPSSFAADDETAHRIVLSTEVFRARLRELPAGVRPLLIFDQFEELSTLFDEAPGDARASAREAQARIVEVLVELLRDETAPLKLLFVFREDYLAKVRKLLESRPELIDQSLRLTPPALDALETIVRGPFEKFPGHFEPELSAELAHRLRGAIESRDGSGEFSLSEVQIVCLRLWESADPEGLFERKGMRGVLEDYLSESLEQFPDELRGPAIAVLSQMVTASGTRNVVSADALVADVRAEEDIAPELVRRALAALEQKTKLVRRERRRDIYLYELVSEFLLPWIRKRRDERLAAHAAAAEAERQRKARKRLALAAGTLLALVAGFGALAILALVQWHEAKTQRRAAQAQAVLARSRAFAFAALEEKSDLGLPPLLSLEAYRLEPASFQARNSLTLSLENLAAKPVSGIVRAHHALLGVALSPSGRLLASAGDDGSLQVWDVQRRGPIGPPRPRSRQPLQAVAFSPDGRLLATGGYDGTVRLWSVRGGHPDGRALHGRFGSIQSGVGSVRSVAFNRDGSILASVGFDKLVWLWDPRSGRQLGSPLRGYKDVLRDVEFSPDGKLVAAGGHHGVVFWNVRTRRRTRQLEAGVLVNAVAFSPDGWLFASGDDDGTVRVWVRGSRVPIEVLRGSRAPVRSVAFDPGSDTLAWASDDGIVRLWRALHADGAVAAEPARFRSLGKSPGQPVTSVVFSSDGQTLVSASADGSIVLWRTATPRGVGRTLEPGGRPLRLACFGTPSTGGGTCGNLTFDSSDRLIAARADGSVASWHLPSSSTHTVSPDGARARAVAFNRSGHVFAAAASNGVVRLWSSTGQPLPARIDTHVRGIVSLALSPDARLVAAGTAAGAIELWHTSRARPVLLRKHRCRGSLREPCNPIFTLKFSHDGRTLASGGYDGIIYLWDVAGGKQRGQPMKVSKGSVDTVEFAPGGKILASGGSDEKLYFWNVATQTRLGEPVQAHGDRVTSLAFDDASKLLVSGGYDGTVRLWDVATRQELGRPLAAGSRHAASVAFGPDGRSVAFAGVDGLIRIWQNLLTPSVQAAEKAVCGRVAGNLSASEWQKYSPGAPYRATCPPR